MNKHDIPINPWDNHPALGLVGGSPYACRTGEPACLPVLVLVLIVVYGLQSFTTGVFMRQIANQTWRDLESWLTNQLTNDAVRGDQSASPVRACIDIEIGSVPGNSAKPV